MIVATRLNIGDFVDFSRSDPMFQAFDDEKKTLLYGLRGRSVKPLFPLKIDILRSCTKNETKFSPRKINIFDPDFFEDGNFDQ